MLWSSVDLTDFAFIPRLCRGKATDGLPGCPLYYRNEETGRWVHPKWEGTTLQERQSIPFGLSYELGAAVSKFLLAKGVNM